MTRGYYRDRAIRDLKKMFSLVLTVAENAHSPSHLNCASCCTDICVANKS